MYMMNSRIRLEKTSKTRITDLKKKCIFYLKRKEYEYQTIYLFEACFVFHGENVKEYMSTISSFSNF